MIDLTDDIVGLAKSIPVLGGRVYRAYPNVDSDVDTPFAIINPATRNVIQTDTDGSELMVSVSFMADFFADSVSELDEIFAKLNELYNSKGLQNIGYNPSYQPTNEMYTANASWSGIVDRRGMVYRG